MNMCERNSRSQVCRKLHGWWLHPPWIMRGLEGAWGGRKWGFLLRAWGGGGVIDRAGAASNRGRGCYTVTRCTLHCYTSACRLSGWDFAACALTRSSVKLFPTHKRTISDLKHLSLSGLLWCSIKALYVSFFVQPLCVSYIVCGKLLK